MTATLVDVSLTEPTDWTYIAEGGASLVVRYVGSPSSTFSGRVLRLRKRPTQPKTSTTLADGIEQDILNFQSDVIAKLLPPGAAPVLQLALVEQAWLEILGERMEPFRPERRREADSIDTSRPYAILAPNLIGETGVSIEIKVSW
jgi:inositol-pentakisphosphate 2-kinase